jgi:serine/threonine protein kinase/Tfp pilus assembly protein PilF
MGDDQNQPTSDFLTRDGRESLTAAFGDMLAPAGVAGGLGEGAGQVVGAYTLLEAIGTGGFGAVWLAERREPMVQRVALKIVKPGMDSAAVLARFEQERQALAVMDHPNVARVFDGGVTERGRPYFVMEYVRGEAITSYADRRRLTLRQRLELFIPVCEAVQHAHHKGLIHRDLKPGNVLVTEIEGKPLPKVIDFGVAKAITRGEWSGPSCTQEGMVIGTPEYMSPEQISGEVDIDTRTDVYSLGVMLYELLTGELPLDASDLRRAALAEVARLIREVTPPKPSARLSQAVEARTTAAAAARATSREQLTSELRRELDWIPLMAIRKERDRRYASPQAMAEDIQRYLEGKPLRAAPESRVYLARKFVRRNRVQVAAAAAVFAALAAGLAVSVWQAREAAWQADRADERAEAAKRAEDAATAARDEEKRRADQLKQVSEFQSEMLRQIDPTRAGIELMRDVHARFASALEKLGVDEAQRASRLEALRAELVHVSATDAAVAMIDRTILRPAAETIDRQFGDQPVTAASLRQAMADLYLSLGLYDAAIPLQESALTIRQHILGDDHPDTLRSMNQIGILLQESGRPSEAEEYLRAALERSRRVFGENHASTLIAINNLGALLKSQGKLDEAEPYYVESLEKSRRTLGQEHPDTLVSISNMGTLRQDQGNAAEAEFYHRDALEKRRRVLGEDDRSTLFSLNNLGFLLRAQGRLAEAEPYLSDALERSRRVLGEEHPETLISISNMASLLQAEGKLAEAELLYREALEKRRRNLGDGHPSTLVSISNLGALLKAQNRLDEAEPYFRLALEGSRRTLGEEHRDTLVSMSNLGSLLQFQGRLPEAERCFREALDKRRRVLGEEHPRTISSMLHLGSVIMDQSRWVEAELCYREAWEKSSRVHGDEHPDTLLALSRVGLLLRAQGKCREALGVLAPAEPLIREAFKGSNAPRLASYLITLARCRLEAGEGPQRFALAEAGLLEARSILVDSPADASTEAIECARALVELYSAWHAVAPGGGYDASATRWRKVLQEADASRVGPSDAGGSPP